MTNSVNKFKMISAKYRISDCILNLTFRYDESSASQNDFGVLQNVSLQAAVVDLMISNYDNIFGEPIAKDPFSILGTFHSLTYY